MQDDLHRFIEEHDRRVLDAIEGIEARIGEGTTIITIPPNKTPALEPRWRTFIYGGLAGVILALPYDALAALH